MTQNILHVLTIIQIKIIINMYIKKKKNGHKW